MSTEIEEDDVIGPTIWEAAAEEEIQENFWCVGPPRAILILSQTSERTMSAPRTSDATHAHPTRSSPVPRILHLHPLVGGGAVVGRITAAARAVLHVLPLLGKRRGAPPLGGAVPTRASGSSYTEPERPRFRATPHMYRVMHPNGSANRH